MLQWELLCISCLLQCLTDCWSCRSAVLQIDCHWDEKRPVPLQRTQIMQPDHTRSIIVWLAHSATPLDRRALGIVVCIQNPSDLRYSASIMEVYSAPPSVRNGIPCMPDSLSLGTFNSLNMFRASDSYFKMYPTACHVVSSVTGIIYQPPPMVLSNGPHMLECTSGIVSVACEVVFKEKGFRTDLHFIQLSQLHLSVILSTLMILRDISKSFRRRCAKRQCHNIHFSASWQDTCRVISCASRQVSCQYLCIQPILVLGPEGIPHRLKVQWESFCHRDCRGWYHTDSQVWLQRPTTWCETLSWDWTIPVIRLFANGWSYLSIDLVVNKSP